MELKCNGTDRTILFLAIWMPNSSVVKCFMNCFLISKKIRRTWKVVTRDKSLFWPRLNALACRNCFTLYFVQSCGVLRLTPCGFDCVSWANQRGTKTGTGGGQSLLVSQIEVTMAVVLEVIVTEIWVVTIDLVVAMGTSVLLLSTSEAATATTGSTT